MTGAERSDGVDRLDGVHDVVAIGGGPFNLGLAALASRIAGLDLVVLEARPELRWHAGVMFDDAELQLPFLADLVTLIDPTHPLSFLAYLRDVDRMYAFYIREQFHPTRREYEDYLRWACARLPAVRFAHAVEAIAWDAARAWFTLDVVRGDGGRLRLAARDLVIGIGTEASVPPALADLPPARLVHSGDYLPRRRDIERADRVTVVGSGQSGAEVVLELLRKNLDGGPAVSWLTRSATFAPLDYTKLTLEMTTPEYIRYFHGLPQEVKDRLVAEHWRHYKGISSQTLERIHDLLYQRDLGQRDLGQRDLPQRPLPPRDLRPALAPVELRAGVAVEAAALDARGDVVLTCRHRDSGAMFEHRTSLVIAATGYRERPPRFLAPIAEHVSRDPRDRYRVRLDHSIELAAPITGRIFVANADLHSHGVAAPDLGIGAYRNATILNTITGREVYALPKRTAYSSFSYPAPGAAERTGRRAQER